MTATLILIAAWVSVACLSDVINTSNAYAIQSVPYQMNFQGRLNNASGAPMAAGTYNMIFRIYSAPTGGSALWTETRAVSASQGVTITSGGLFSVQLGSVTSLPSNIFNTSSPLYLEVELPSPATATTTSPSWTEGPMGPRNPIVSSPFAVNSDLLDGLDSSAFAASSGSTNYIQNQSASPQSASFKISGTGTAASLQAASLDTASSGTLTLGGSNATSIVLAPNVTVGAGKTLTLGGGATGTRPASPAEGTLYYDTTTHQTLTYSNGKWQADSKATTVVVAAGNSTQSAKDSAQYVGDGVNDQNAINAAIASLPASGGRVVLLEGVYAIGGTISANVANLTIMGQGNVSTVLIRMYNAPSAGDGIITISQSYVTVRDLAIAGNSSSYTNTNNDGIYKQKSVSNYSIENLLVAVNAGHGIDMDGDATLGNGEGQIINNKIASNGGDGIHLVYADSTKITGNEVDENGGTGIEDGGSSNSVISNNTLTGNTQNGISMGYSDIVSSNNVSNSGQTGIITGGFGGGGSVISNFVAGGEYGIGTNPGAQDANISDNTVVYTSDDGIYINNGTTSSRIAIKGNKLSSIAGTAINAGDTSNSVIADNTIDSSGGTDDNASIYVAGQTNTITGNKITSPTGYALNIGGDHNYLAGNVYDGTGHDSGVSTTYAGQGLSNGGLGDFLYKPGEDTATAFQVQNAAGNSVLNINSGSSITSLNGSAVIQSNSAGSSAPVAIGSTATNASGATSKTVTTYGGTHTGDLVIVAGYVEPNNESSASATYGSFTAPSGVTLATGFPINTDDSTMTSGDTHRLYIWYYYATADGAQNLTFTNTQNVYWGLTATTIRGGATSGNPFADTPATATVSRTASGTTTTPNVSLTLGGTNSLVLWVFGDWDATDRGNPTGYSRIVSATGSPGQPTVSSRTYGGSGSTGSVTTSSGPDEGMTAALLSFRGAGVPAASALAVKDVNGNQVLNIMNSGQAIFQNSSDSSTAFQIQNAAGVVALNVDTTTNAITLGSGSNTVTFTTSNGLIASGTAQHLKKIQLTAEYAGAVLDAASDSTCTSANSGTMTSGFDSSNTANYYNWTSSSASAQCYDVVVQIPLPTDFSSWGTNPATLNIQTSNTSNGTLNLQWYDTAHSLQYDNSITPGTAGSWQVYNVVSNPAGTYAAGGSVMVKIRMSAKSSANVKLGDITLSYYSKF